MNLHEELNLFEKYQIDMIRTMEIICRRFPDEVDMGIPEEREEEI